MAAVAASKWLWSSSAMAGRPPNAVWYGLVSKTNCRWAAAIGSSAGRGLRAARWSRVAIGTFGSGGIGSGGICC